MAASTTEDKVAHLLEQSRKTTITLKRLDNLQKVKELICDNEPDLLDNFLDEMIEHNEDDESSIIRQFIVQFILSACKADPEVIPKVIDNLMNLLGDDNINVAKDAIIAFSHVYRYAVIWLANRPLDDTHESTWKNLNELRNMVFTLVETDNDGMRSTIIKVFENVIITLSTSSKSSDFSKKSSYDNHFSIDRVAETHKLLDTGTLKLQALRILNDLLAYAQSSSMSYLNLTAMLNTLVLIIRQRPQYNLRIMNIIVWIHDTQLSMEKRDDPEVNPNKIAWKFQPYQLDSLKKCMKLLLLPLVSKPVSIIRSIRVLIIKMLRGSWLDCAEKQIDKYLPQKVTCQLLLAKEKNKTQFTNEGEGAGHRKSSNNLVESVKIEAQAQTSGANADSTQFQEGMADDIDDNMVDNDELQDQDRFNSQQDLALAELDIKPMTKDQQTDVTRKVFSQTLSVENAVNIILTSIEYLPKSMPEVFKNEYRPIGNITVHRQKENLSFLLAKLVTLHNLGEGAQQAKAIQEKIEEIEATRRRFEKPGLVQGVFDSF